MIRSTNTYLDCIRDAAAGGAALMKSLIEASRPLLFERAAAATDPRERNPLQDSLRLLNQHEAFLCRRFPELLLADFTAANDSVVSTASPAGPTLRFDLLELMNESQVQERVEVARIQQAVMLATDADLAELNRLICGAQGLNKVYVDRNPLRPEVYARCLREALRQTGVASAVWLMWMQYLGQSLGKTLVASYQAACRQLKGHGVEPAPYQVTQNFGGRAVSAARQEGGHPAAGGVAKVPGRGPDAYRSGSEAVDVDLDVDEGFDGDTPLDAMDVPDSQSATLLTLSHLRALLAGELPADDESQSAPSAAGSRSRKAAKAPIFAHTVPAAFETLAEMRQVETVMQRLATRRQGPATHSLSADGAIALDSSLRTNLRESARGMGQALGLEVVSLMVENIVADERIAQPVRAAVATLEPALLRLALADPRFFSDRKHAARQLLDQITQRALGFASAQDEGFEAFIVPVQSAVQAMAQVQEVSPELFEMALSALHEEWESLAARDRKHRDKAMQALLQAEQRKLLAEQISHELRAHVALPLAPSPVVAMLLGPWSQVIARDRLAHPDQGLDPGGYAAIVDDLLWSVRLDLERVGRDRLLKLIPGLIGKLREGLSSIDYPFDWLQEFLDTLMTMHQNAMKPATARQVLPPAAASSVNSVPPTVSVTNVAGMTDAASVPMTLAELQAHFEAADAADVWLVGKEAQDSGFMDYLPDDHPVATLTPLDPEQEPAETSTESDMASLTRVGNWVELQVNESWVRSQLTWASPQGSLFMFSSVGGAAHSMTQRTLARLLTEGQIRLIASQALVDGALDAVAQKALRNSVDSVI